MSRGGPASWRHTLLLVLILLSPAGAPSALAGQASALGLCPPERGRFDGFMQTICEAESALAAGKHSDAIERFRRAAEWPRLQATNELAWAGLAAAYCRAQDPKQGREWAARFDEARRLWLGETDCATDTSDGARGARTFVRERMCVEPLAADYGFVKKHPEAPASIEIVRRFASVAERIDQYCSATVPTGMSTKAQPLRKKAKKRVSGRRASPARGR
jgi:hypothetical protein